MEGRPLLDVNFLFGFLAAAANLSPTLLTGSLAETFVRAVSMLFVWLVNKCEPLPFDDRIAAVPVPKFYTIHKGSTTIHSSHDIRSVRGISFCFVCGAFGKVKLHRLASSCVGYFASKIDEIRRDKLMKCELPVKGMCWPCGTPYVMNPPSLSHHPLSFVEESTDGR